MIARKEIPLIPIRLTSVDPILRLSKASVGVRMKNGLYSLQIEALDASNEEAIDVLLRGGCAWR
jgi:hypothetical protein